LKVDIEDVSSCKKIIKIEIPTEDVNAEFEKSYKEIRTTIPVRGFRKGKAPRSVLKARFSEYVKKDVIDNLVEPAFKEAVEDAKFHILRAPDAEQDMNPPIDKLSVVENEPLSFEITVNVKPEIILPDLERLEIEKGDVNVTEEDVNDHIESLREERADFIPMEDRPLQNGDYATLSIKGTSDDDVLMNQNEQVFEVGDNMPIPELADHLVGMESGDEKEFSITFPEAAAVDEVEASADEEATPADEEASAMDTSGGSLSERLAGKEVNFEVKLHKITEKHLPLLDDDFAKDLNAENIQQLTATVWNQLVEYRRWQKEEIQKSELLDQLLEKSQFEVPEFMVEDRIKAMISYTGSEGDDIDEKEFAEYRSTAVDVIKRMWILDEIVQREEISVEDEEVEAEVAALAIARDRDPQKYMKLMEDAKRLEGIRDNILNRKIFNLLIEKASAKRTLIV